MVQIFAGPKLSLGTGFFMRFMDVIGLAVAAQLASYFHFGTFLHTTQHIYTVLLSLCCALAFFVFPQFDLYKSWRGRFLPLILGRLLSSLAGVLLIGLFFSFVFYYAGDVSRRWLFYWYLIGFIVLGMYRIILYFILRFFRSRGINTKRVVIVGYGKIGQEMYQRTKQQGWYGYKVTAIYATGSDISHVPSSDSVDYLSKPEDILGYAIKNKVNEIWITVPLSHSSQLLNLQYLLRNALIDIRWVPDTLGLQILSNKMSDFLGFPALDLNRPISDGWGGIIKYTFDKIFAVIALILLSPLFLVIAAAIKISSPGPIFFKQARLGLNGKEFMVYKFRSMKLHQEHKQITQATRHDPRITRIGQFLRRTSLDELPQFINVLIGDMSIIGPRPHALQHNEMYKELLDLYMVRHRVKPGITGWAQIHGFRGETDTVDKMEKRVQFDLYYIRNWSLLMDFRILVWTIFKGWTDKNAY